MTRTITDRTIDILQILERKTDDKHPLNATDIKKLTNAIKAYEEFSSKAVYRSMNILKFWYPGITVRVPCGRLVHAAGIYSLGGFDVVRNRRGSAVSVGRGQASVQEADPRACLPERAGSHDPDEWRELVARGFAGDCTGAGSGLQAFCDGARAAGGGGHVVLRMPGESGDPDLQGHGFQVHPGGPDREAGAVCEMTR